MFLLSLLALLFLLEAFFLSTIHISLNRLGETLSSPLLEKFSFFYLRFHRFFFKKRVFDLLIIACSIASNLARFGFALTALLLLLSLSAPLLFAVALFFLFAFLLLGDFLPHLIGRKMPQKALRYLFAYGAPFLFLTLPLFLLPLYLLKRAFRRAAETDESRLDDMKETIVKILQDADIQGHLNAADEKLIESVVLFKERIVREVMIPRVKLFCLASPTTIREAAHLLATEGYSRNPIYTDNIDNIIGMLMYKDILEIYMQCEAGKRSWSFLNEPILKIARPVFYTPETKRVPQLLQEFRAKQMHMAIVVDEYGGTAGVVTIEDLLEEIVGEIADEYDVKEETLYTTVPGETGWIVDARMNIKDAQELFGITIEEEGDYDTIGGYLFHKLGAIPSKGAVLDHEDFELTILSSTSRSVDKVKIIPHPPKEVV